MSNKKTVLVITSAFPRFKEDYGDRFIFTLCDKLSPDFNIIVLAPKDKNSLENEMWGNLKIYRHRQRIFGEGGIAYGSGIMNNLKKKPWLLFSIPVFFIFQILALKKIIKEQYVDLIHAHWIIPQGISAVLFKRLFNKKIKIIATVHGSDLNSFNNSLGRATVKSIFSKIDTLTVVSHALKSKAIDKGFLRKIYVFPMGIDTNNFNYNHERSTIKKRYDIKGPLLLFVGTVTEGKGIKLLLEAMPAIIREHPDVKLLAVGNGNQKKEMEEYAISLKIASNVIFTGAIDHSLLPDYYNSADIFILPSYSEGFGLVIAESMSCECITLASNLDAIRDIIDDKITGFLLEEINSECIAESVLEIFLLDDDKKNKIKKAARKKIIENFDWQIAAENYRSIYNSSLN